jgi:hypothetical protein
MKFISEGVNALIVSKPDPGKGYVPKAVAYRATLEGYQVRHIESDTNFARYGLASPGEHADLLRHYVEPDVLVFDDLFLDRRLVDVSAKVIQAILR